MSNKIKGLFYKINETEIIDINNELNNLGYLLDFKVVDTINLLKSELMNWSWDIMVIENDEDNSRLEEILDFIDDINSNTSVLVITEVISPKVVNTVFKYGKNDIVPKQDKCQVCLALIRSYEQTKTLSQANFTKKELLRMQKTQYEHESFLNQVIESTTNPIFYKGLEGRYLGCNTAFANFIGLPKDQIIGKTVFDVSPPKLAQKYFEKDQEFFKNPVTQQYEYQVVDSENKVMDVMFYKTAIKDSEGNVVGLLGHMFDITERKKLEKEVFKEKELAQLLLDTAKDIFISLDLEGNITLANKRTSEILEYPKESLIGKNWFEHFVSPEEKEKLCQIYQDILSGKIKKDEKVETTILTPLKKKKKILWTNKLVYNDEHDVVGILSVGKEIVNKGELEQELEESEKKYRTLVENMHEGVGIIDLNESVVFCNKAFNRIFGLEDDTMLGKNITDYISDDDLWLVHKETDKRKEDKESQYKIRIRREDGKYRVINISSVPWKNTKNEVVGAIGLVTDVTAQDFATKRLEQKIKIEQSIIRISSQFISAENFQSKLDATLSELKNIIEAERYGMLILQKGILQLVSHQFNENYQENQIDLEKLQLSNFEYGMNMLNSLDFVFFNDIRELPDEAKAEKELFEQHNIFNFLGLPFYTGKELTGLLVILNMYDVDDWTIEDLSSLRTVTEIIGHAFNRNKAEDKVRQLNEDLVTKNNELEQVVYVTSHDIRSPVVNILGFSDEMIKALNKLANKIFEEPNEIHNKEDIEYLINKDIPNIMNFIKVSGQKIDKLLLALLKLSRLGRAAINKVNVDMNQLIQSVLNTYEFQIKQENIQIELDDLPGCYTDEVAINQVFSNLVDNAIKYRSHDRPSVIKITGRENEDMVSYSIEDNGIGISETELDKIFDVFYRIDPENQQGEGIGLSLIKKTIERLGGSISVGSTLDKGAKFNIGLEKRRD